MKKIFGLFSVIFISFVFSTIANAQIGGVNIQLDPANPTVGEQFTAKVDSYSFDLDKAEYTWVLGEKTIQKGFGKKSISLNYPNNSTFLGVFITTPTGETYKATYLLTEKSLSLIFEGADSYTPTWYKGKKQVAYGGKVRVVAIANIADQANGGYLNNEDISYTWKVNGEIINQASGLGKYYADIQLFDEQGDEVSITVTAKPRLIDDSISKTIYINQTYPEVYIYEDSPYVGIIEQKPIKETTFVNKGDLKLTAEPFFFSANRNRQSSTLKYYWTINDKAEEMGSFSRIFKLGANGGGSANINLRVINETASKLMQESSDLIKINF